MLDALVQSLAPWWELAVAYFPLGVVGLWRWGSWGVRKVYALTYRAPTGRYEEAVSVVTPVYNENPDVFGRALVSWRDNGVREVVAVIDYTDTACLKRFREFARGWAGARLIVTRTPGKRPALADGVRAAAHPIVALVDSDTIWAAGVREAALIPFADPRVGGVATRQRVWRPRTLAQRVFNAQLNMRYFEELPFMTTRGGSVVTCLSGRTAFYRRAALLPVLEAMVNETFWGVPVISGEDKCLTYLVEGAGWNVAFQQRAQVYTPGAPDFAEFLMQRLRWTRNSWRADLRTLTQAWVWAHPRFVLYLLDRVVQPFTQLLAPSYFLVSLMLGRFEVAAVLLAWWHLSRAVRFYPHLKRVPQDWWLLPELVGVTMYLAVMKIYALVTLNRQGWITRWDKGRLPVARLTATVVAYVVTLVVVGSLAAGVAAYELTVPGRVSEAELRARLQPLPASGAVATPLAEPAIAVLSRHRVRPGETLGVIAGQYGVPVEILRGYNAPWLPSRDHVEPGLWLSVPPAGARAPARDPFISDYGRLGPLKIRFEPATNTIVVTGRGQQVRLGDLKRALSGRQLVEVEPRVFELNANLALKAGVSLLLDRSEVEWLRLASDPTGFIRLSAVSAQISIQGVRVTSWDREAQRFDEQLDDGRSYVIATGNSRLDVDTAELAYLGFARRPGDPNATFGVVWQQSGEGAAASLVTGMVTNSRFHHNYDGAYASGARGMAWRGNEFTDNVRYGLDLFGGAAEMLVEGNTASRNGRHGIILSTGSAPAHVAGNTVADNHQHGIMVHRGGEAVVVAANRVVGNVDGVVVYDSARVVVRDNDISRNERGIRVSGGATEAVVVNNSVAHNRLTGVVLTGGSRRAWVTQNVVTSSEVGMAVKAVAHTLADNRLEGNTVGVLVAAPATETRLARNTVTRNQTGIRLAAGPDAATYAADNQLVGNVSAGWAD